MNGPPLEPRTFTSGSCSDDLAEEERTHESRADALEKDKLRPDVKDREDEAERRLFVLRIASNLAWRGSWTGLYLRLPLCSQRRSPPTVAGMPSL